MISPDKVKMFIRDRADLNYLLNNEEQFEDEEIAAFEEDVKNEIVLMYPALTPNKDKLPDILVIYGIISKLMESVANQENRNQMTVGDDNVGQIDFSNKADKYLSLASYYNQKMNELAKNITARDYYTSVWGDVEMPSADFEYYYGGDY